MRFIYLKIIKNNLSWSETTSAIWEFLAAIFLEWNALYTTPSAPLLPSLYMSWSRLFWYESCFHFQPENRHLNENHSQLGRIPIHQSPSHLAYYMHTISMLSICYSYTVRLYSSINYMLYAYYSYANHMQFIYVRMLTCYIATYPYRISYPCFTWNIALGSTWNILALCNCYHPIYLHSYLS